MAEYIERDEAVRKALEACIKVVGHGITQMEAVDIADIIDSIPTADVVSVVRCKDCKYFLLGRLACIHPYHNGWCGIDHYCSYGERRCEE
jgi:hypothetical protein